MPWRVLGSLAVLLIVACSGEERVASETSEVTSRPSPTAPEARAAVLSCADVIDSDTEVPAQYRPISDAVALPTAESAAHALQVSQQPARPAPNFFAKTGLVLRSDAVVSIRVEEPADVALIGWGSPAEFATEVSSPGCPGGEWIAFAGGFLVDQPSCVELTVTVGGDHERVQVGVGAPCPGQQPPP